MKILSSSAHHHVISSLYDFLSSLEHKYVYNKFCPYYENQWGPKQHWSPLTSMYGQKTDLFQNIYFCVYSFRRQI